MNKVITSYEELSLLDWIEFEKLIAELFTSGGYTVEAKAAGGADGGVDIFVSKGDHKAIVQCKYWSKNKVGVKPIRELWGLVDHHSADAAYLFCLGSFTKKAEEFSKRKAISLITGRKLVNWIRNPHHNTVGRMPENGIITRNKPRFSDADNVKINSTLRKFKRKQAKLPTLFDVHGQIDGKDMVIGRLSYDFKRTNGAFEWSDEAVSTGVEWSPIHLPLEKKFWLAGWQEEKELSGLPGLIHDILPDGWGLKLMDMAFRQNNIFADRYSPTLRIATLGLQTIGSLHLKPSWSERWDEVQQATLADLTLEASLIDNDINKIVSETMLCTGCAPHGARPKILVAINSGGDHALVGHETLPDGYRHVLVKFAARDEHPSAPPLEYCYVEAASRAGIETAPTQLLEIRGNPAICFDRFDRVEGQKRHVHSLAGMMHVTHRVANTDWEHVAGILKRLPGGEAGLHEAFRRAVFNAVFCVRDDHAKNHAFLRHPDNQWAMTPAYDIAYSDGPGGYHTMMYAGHTGKNVTAQDLVRLGEHFGVDVAAVAAERERALEARTHMMSEAKGLGVPKTILANIVRRFKEIDKDMKPKAPRKKPSTGT